MPKPILLVDNQDSFTMNIRQIVYELGYDITIISYTELQTTDFHNFDKIIISPGPGHPTDYPKYFDIFNNYISEKSFLGICLGMQIIGLYYGAKVKQCSSVEHGKQSRNRIFLPSPIFKNIPNNALIGRYHSWSLEKDEFPNELIINSIAEDNEIMSITHKEYRLYGLQFHPESYITEYGDKIIENWIRID